MKRTHRLGLAADSSALTSLLLILATMGLARITPKLSDTRWTELDAKLADRIGPLHHLLGSGDLPSDVAADQLGAILTEFLSNEPEFEEVEEEYFEKKQSTSLEEARILKRELRKRQTRETLLLKTKPTGSKLSSFILFS